jgi:GlpG protein
MPSIHVSEGPDLMRQLATIADERAANTLADHLLTLDVTTRVDRSANGWIVWVHREDKMDLARRELDAFLANPDDPRYQVAAKVAKVTRREKAKLDRLHARNTRNLSGRLNVPTFERCPITYSLIALSVAVAIFTGLGKNIPAVMPFVLTHPTVKQEWRIIPTEPDSEESDRFVKAERVRVPVYRPGGLDLVKQGQVWRLLTPIVIHFGILHLAFNMMMLYRLGGLIELRKGKLVMAGLVVASAIVSNLGEYFWDLQAYGPNKAPWLVGGMSGVIYALFGYCWMTSDYDPEADMKMPSDLILQMIAWLFFCMTGMLGNVANAAHVAGLLFGLLVGVAPHLFLSWRWW